MAIIEKTVNTTGATATPSGITIARNGMKFVVSWKIIATDHGAGQQLQWRLNRGKTWHTVAVPNYATSTVVEFSETDFYPSTGKRVLTIIEFRVRGKQAKTTTVSSKTSGSDTIRTTTNTTYSWSKWAERGFNLAAPNVPTITVTTDAAQNTSTFAWETKTSTKDRRPFRNTQYQTMLVKDCTETDGSKLTWKSTKLGWGTGVVSSGSGSISRTEDSDRLAAASYTRWVRVRSRGAGGASAWRYARHVYARPYTATIESASVTRKATARQTVCTVKWTLKTGAAHPADYVEAQWLIGNPDSGRTAPAGADWEVGAVVADTSGTDTVKFTVDDLAGENECMWVRIVAVHDSNTSATAPKLVYSGALSAPTGLSVSGVNTTGIVTITATNTAADDVPDSRLAVVHSKYKITDYVCGIIPHGQSSVTVQVPTWTGAIPPDFSVYAFQGTAKSSQRADGLTQYAVTANMQSSALRQGGDVPTAPSDVTATLSDTPGEIIVEWTWDWQAADRAEVSWSTNPYAWESNIEPQTYVLTNSHAAKLRISDLEQGVIWYIRVRLAQTTDEDPVYGPYSARRAVDLAVAPGKPILALSDAVIPPDTKNITASWNFTAEDGTKQGYAEICEAAVNGDSITYGTRLAKVTTVQHATIQTSSWASGEKSMCVRVTGANGLESEWSDPVSVTVADPLTCTISQTSLTEETVTDPDETTRTVTALAEMPLTATITGAGAGGTTTLVIERAESYQMDRPDESVFNGFEGETIVSYSQTGENEITINQEDLIGMLDDGAAYRLVATVQDGLGQSDTATQDFMVLWSHQAIMPEGTETADTDNLIAVITPTAPELTQEGDVCDIYRLSADKPELIVSGGTWGTDYVDPYPAIGETGGHRIVFRTVNGDYITPDNHPAWVDVGEPLPIQDVIVDFDGVQLRLPYNLDLANTWRKNFQETTYLGGSVQGDWNPAVSRTGSIGTTSIVTEDADTIRSLRRLAVYPGICHVRTPDGSSYAADVQVSETRVMGQGSRLANFNLTVTRVDPEGLDGLTYEQWAEEEAET